MTPEIWEALQGLLVSLATWAGTGLLRWLAPSFWRDLDKRQFRLAVVAVVAVVVAVLVGLTQGLGWASIARLGVTALTGSVFFRQVTKPPQLEYGGKSLGRNLSIRTKL